MSRGARASWWVVSLCAGFAGCGAADDDPALDGPPPAQEGGTPDASVQGAADATAPDPDGGPIARRDGGATGPDGAPTPPRVDGAVAPDGSAPGPDGAPPDGTCRPDRDAWAASIRPLLADRCGLCHGESPSFGAPFTLLDYDGLLAGEPGARRADRVAVRVGEGTMPPAGQPRLTNDEAQRLLEWATCGEAQGGPLPGGFEVDVPVLGAPAEPPADAEFFDVLAPGYAVPLADDHYECFVIEAPIRGDRFIRRIEAIIDESAVVHHAVLMRGDQGRAPGQSFSCNALVDPVYAWAPGTGPLQFPEGGIRVRPGQRFTLQIHYNNRLRTPGLRDESGLRVYHAPPAGAEVGMTPLGPTDIRIPARQQARSEGVCDIREPTRIIASWPHMHELGYAFETWVEHPDGSTTPLMTLRGWDFHSQFLYDTPLDLRPGDRVHTRCTWRNMSDRTVRFGEDTGDEMCFNFLYHSPPMASSYCNRDPDEPPPEEPPPPPPVPEYGPGACAPPLDPADVPALAIGVAEGEPPAPMGDVPDDGLWVFDGGALHVPTFRLPIGAIDPEATVVAGHGVLSLEGGAFALDLDALAHIVLSDGRVFDVRLPMSLAGARRPGAAPGELVVTPDCGDVGGEMSIRLGLEGDRLHAVYADRRIGFPIWLALDLRRIR